MNIRIPYSKHALVALMMAAAATSARADLDNGTFADYDAIEEGTVNYPSETGAPGWYVQADSPGGTDIVTDESLDSPADPSVMRSNKLESGFGGNKNEQCVAFDSSERLAIDFLAFSERESLDGLKVRINPTFYANMDDCIEDIHTDGDADLRLSGDDDNNDLDVDLGAVVSSGEWTRINEDEAAQTMSYGPGGSGAQFSYPDGANVMLLSVRMRDRSDDGDPDLSAEPLYLDDIRVIQEGSPANLVLNGDFSHRPLAKDDEFVADEGWIVDRFDDFPAAVGPAWFALEDANVYYSEGQGGGYGDAKIDQCFDLNGVDRIAPEFFAMAMAPDAELSGRIAVDIHDDVDCGGDKLVELESDFDGLNVIGEDSEAGQWYSLLAAGENDGNDEINEDLAADYPDAESAFISIRLRDKSDDGDPNPDVPRAIFVDDVNITSQVSTPLVSPLPGDVRFADESDEVSVTVTSDTDNVEIYYTTDGSDPDPDTSETVNSGDSINVTAETVVKALAVDMNDDAVRSSIRTANYGGASSGDDSDSGDDSSSGDDSNFGGGGGSTPSSGCSLSANPGAPDPTLPALVLLALAGIYARRYLKN
ncbi:chitobiase/beta-hexosaminidase C-terminal domain-containing protein [Marinobacter sp. HL-58]|uniref:chitobiase/beta-hexosaminidase C-terminal domain-containing protein n=1 Tax=Marinobacter sp. HL-58 TaxID=1479237 RepID=UPI000489157B|nr:chitobiase/beta-hexosaminidase C-terminal domain-containing protein [Marinobacter sp. HL-58]KPQ02921.1 MAG: Chitobiase/beta-hexosaminidase C-terminal domain [Marinobacter sp. HL-58]